MAGPETSGHRRAFTRFRIDIGFHIFIYISAKQKKERERGSCMTSIRWIFIATAALECRTSSWHLSAPQVESNQTKMGFFGFIYSFSTWIEVDYIFSFADEFVYLKRSCNVTLWRFRFLSWQIKILKDEERRRKKIRTFFCGFEGKCISSCLSVETRARGYPLVKCNRVLRWSFRIISFQFGERVLIIWLGIWKFSKEIEPTKGENVGGLGKTKMYKLYKWQSLSTVLSKRWKILTSVLEIVGHTVVCMWQCVTGVCNT